MKKVLLHPRGVKKILSGRLWLSKRDVLRAPSLQPGELATVWTPEGQFLGQAYFHPESHVFGRLLSREAEAINRVFFARRFLQALHQRQQLYPGESCFRLIHAEGDFLPGLTIDLYDQIVVVQITTAGMERLKGEILAAIEQALAPRGIVLKNDLPVRQEEGLPLYVEAEGVSQPFVAIIDGFKFLIDPFGQKTGFFLDQRENRRRLARYVKGREVLDLFCYTGAFAIYAAAYGAKKVIAVDRSEKALALAEENARLNNLLGPISFVQDEAEHFLRSWRETEVLLLDPPAFIKHYRARERGKKRYLSLNRLALQNLASGGVLFTSSCSQWLSLEELEDLVRQAAIQESCPLQLLEIGLQALDHPALLSMPETLYLKGLWLLKNDFSLEAPPKTR